MKPRPGLNNYCIHPCAKNAGLFCSGPFWPLDWWLDGEPEPAPFDWWRGCDGALAEAFGPLFGVGS